MSKRVDRIGKVIGVGFAVLACIFNPNVAPLLFCMLLGISVLVILATTDTSLWGIPENDNKG